MIRTATCALLALLLALPAAAQPAPQRPQVELRPPPAWMTDPPGRPQVELRRAPDWLVTPDQAAPDRQRPAAPKAAPARPAQPRAEDGTPEAPRPAPRRVGIGTVDPRVPMNTSAAPWRGVGRLQRDGVFCTGALVGPRSVLTAAHCLVGRGEDGRRIMPASSFRFLLGYDRGRWAAEARVQEIRIDPDYSASGRNGGPQWADWALLTLDRAIGTPDRILPLMRDLPDADTPVMTGGYQQDRREVLMADPDCRVVGLSRQGLGRPMLLHDCTATRGASGGPVLAELPGGEGWAVAGVLVSMSRGVALGFAVPAEVLPPLPD